MRAVTKPVELTYEVPFSLPSWFIEDDVKMPEPTTQDYCCRDLVSVLTCDARRRARNVQIHRNRALRWDEENPGVGVDPDVCVLDPAPDVADQNFKSICVWKPGFAPPRIAVEIVSESTAAKDYDEGPAKYAASGTQELWVFDPQRYGPTLHGGPWVLQVWERGRGGSFRRTFAGDGPAWSEALQAWLMADDDGVRLHICDDEEGMNPWPTEAEYAESEKQRADTEKQRADTEKQRADTERTEKNAALARIAELEALLGRSAP